MKNKKELQLEEQSKLFLKECDLWHGYCDCYYCTEKKEKIDFISEKSNYENYKEKKIRENKINEILYNNYRVTIEDYIKNI